MKEDDVLAVIEGQTKKKLAAIKGTALAAEQYRRRTSWEGRGSKRPSRNSG